MEEIKLQTGSGLPKTLEECMYEIQSNMEFINTQMQNADSETYKRLTGLIKDEKIKLLTLYETSSKHLGLLDREDRIILVQQNNSARYDKIFELRNQILNLRREIDSMNYSPMFNDNDKKVLSEATNKNIKEKIQELLKIYKTSFKEEKIINEQDQLVLVENDNKEEYNELVKSLSKLEDIEPNRNINTCSIGKRNPRQEELLEELSKLQKDNEALFKKTRDIYLDMKRILKGIDKRLSSFYKYCSVMMWFNLIIWFVVLLTLIFKN